MTRSLTTLAAAALVSAALVAPAAALPTDESEPVVHVSLPGGSLNGWFSAASVRFTASVSDVTLPASGLATAALQLSGAHTHDSRTDLSQSQTSYSFPEMTLTNEGITTIRVSATDRAGNAGSGSIDVRIDRSKPTVTLTGPIATRTTFYQDEQVTVGFQCADAVSWVEPANCSGTTPNGGALDTATVGTKTLNIMGRDQAGNEEHVDYRYTVVEKRMSATAPPTFTGTAQAFSTLTGQPATFTPAPDSVTCHWFRRIDGGFTQVSANGEPLQLTAGNVGHEILYRCVASKAGFPDATAWSAESAIVRAAPWPPGYPSTDGVRRVGEVLMARVPQGPAGATYTYRWLSRTNDGGYRPVAGATASTLTLLPEHLGLRFAVEVRGEAAGYQTWQADTTQQSGSDSYPVLPRRFTTIAPSVAGAAVVGQRLTASLAPVTAEGAGPLAPYASSVEWLRDGQPIPGATAATYVPSAADAGRAISVRQTLSGAGYETAVRASAPVRVAAATPSVTAAARSPKARTVRITVTVAAPGLAPDGTVTVHRGARKVGTAVVRAGTVTLTLKRQRPGRARYTVQYAGGPGVAAGSATAVVKVRR